MTSDPRRPPEPEPVEFEFTRGWALKQMAKVAIFTLLLLFAMRETDLDSRRLAEARARRDLVLGLGTAEATQGKEISAAALSRLAVEYLTRCRDCAESARCEAALEDIRRGRLGRDGDGPCRTPILGSWLAKGHPR